MSEPENFLSRWARLKHAAADPAGDPPDAAPPSADPAGAPPTAAAATPADPAVELPALPSIESITSATDIRGFMMPGVPAALTRAALRRAWSADPAIRDFIGIAENQWDFTAADGIPGFGSLSPLDDVGKLVAQILGDAAPEPPQSTKDIAGKLEQLQNEQQETPEVDVEDSTIVVDESPDVPTIPAVADVATQDHAAAQHDDLKQPSPDTVVRRRHGGALPS